MSSTQDERPGLATAEMAFLGSRREALVNLGNRVGLPDYKSLATALIQSEKYGTSMAETLRVLSHENREARKTRATEKASRLPAILTIPMIIFIFPALFVVILGPAAVQTIRIMF